MVCNFELSKKSSVIIYILIIIVIFIGLMMVFMSQSNAWVNGGGVVIALSVVGYIFMSYYKPLALQMPDRPGCSYNPATGRHELVKHNTSYTDPNTVGPNIIDKNMLQYGVPTIADMVV